MASGFRIEVDGDVALQRSLLAASKAAGVLVGVNREAANLLAAGAMQRAPRRSGRLSSSIRVLDVTNAGADIGSGLIYAGVQERGWKAHNIRPRWYIRGSAKETNVTPVYSHFLAGVATEIRGA